MPVTHATIPLHGGQLRQIAARFALPVSELLDFSANINPEGPPPSTVDALRDALENPSFLTTYPDLEEIQLKASLGTYSGVSPAHLSVANGFVPLLEAALRTLSVRRCLLPVPAFVEYRAALERARVHVTPCVLRPEANFAYELEPLLSQFHSDAFDTILLANPQNPSGVLCDRTKMMRLIDEAGARNIRVLLDEAFIDYAPAQSLATEVQHLPHVMVFRSVTKFHGCPGLRVAYAIANGSITATLNAHLPPWPITTLAALAVRAALADDAFTQRTLSLNVSRREHLLGELADLPLQVYSSAANFLLFRLPPAIEASNFWTRLICEHRIVLRDCSNFESLPAGYFRCAVRTPKENAQLVAALRTVLEHPR